MVSCGSKELADKEGGLKILVFPTVRISQCINFGEIKMIKFVYEVN